MPGSKTYTITPEAAADIEDIWQFIAEDSVENADRVEAAITNELSFLTVFPESGRIVTGYTRLLRSWPVPRYPTYVIFYLVQDDEIFVARIAHGARDVSRLL